MKALAFDLFGTLVDPSKVAAAAPNLPGSPDEFVATWRAKQIEYTFLLSIVGRFLPFSEVTKRSLRASANLHRVPLTPEGVESLLRAWRFLPPYPDVKPAIMTLKDGCRLAVLTNADTAMARDVLRHSALREFFPVVVSADEVGVYKPSPRLYAQAAVRLALPLPEIVLISSNPFDVLGAKSAGMAACWVNREGGLLDELDTRPDFEVRSMIEVPLAIAGALG